MSSRQGAADPPATATAMTDYRPARCPFGQGRARSLNTGRLTALAAPCPASDTRRHSSRQETSLLLECLLEMPNNTPNEKGIELLQGTLDMLILRTLQWGPQHGHGVGQAIRQRSVDLLQIERGSLYPALHRLEARGLIALEWKASDLNPRAKY